MTTKKRGLDKGLDTLLAETLGSFGMPTPEGKVAAPASLFGSQKTPSDQTVVTETPLEQLSAGRFQPRKEIQHSELEPLADSIRAQGILQPLVVRKIGRDKFEIIAGERRWRAAKLAGLTKVPCLIKEVNDKAAAAIALIENIQREALNPLETAVAYERLAHDFALTHAQVAQAVGKSRASVTNLLRLLNLKPEVKLMLERGDLEVGHAKVILSAPPTLQVTLAREVVGQSLSVRETEKLVARKLNQTGAPVATAAAQPPKDPNVNALQQRLSDTLGAVVKIKHQPKGRGKITIEYNNLDELDGILAHIR